MGVSVVDESLCGIKRLGGEGCSSEGNLNFNCRLLFVPDRIVDYVVIHELALFNLKDRKYIGLQEKKFGVQQNYFLKLNFIFFNIFIFLFFYKYIYIIIILIIYKEKKILTKSASLTQFHWVKLCYVLIRAKAESAPQDSSVHGKAAENTT